MYLHFEDFRRDDPLEDELGYTVALLNCNGHTSSIPGARTAYAHECKRVLTFEILVREVEQQDEDDTAVVCINDARASVDHELGR